VSQTGLAAFSVASAKPADMDCDQQPFTHTQPQFFAVLMVSTPVIYVKMQGLLLKYSFTDHGGMKG